MKLSDKGRALLIELEGKRNHVYKDVAGLKTIGVGHLLKPGETWS
jgi:GH24 family phage-related lysozyme (muramidase)